MPPTIIKHHRGRGGRCKPSAQRLAHPIADAGVDEQRERVDVALLVSHRTWVQGRSWFLLSIASRVKPLCNQAADNGDNDSEQRPAGTLEGELAREEKNHVTFARILRHAATLAVEVSSFPVSLHAPRHRIVNRLNPTIDSLIATDQVDVCGERPSENAATKPKGALPLCPVSDADDGQQKERKPCGR